MPIVAVVRPRFGKTDLSFIKHIPLPYEGMRMDFRAEFFNAWKSRPSVLPAGGRFSAIFLARH